jgi:hypothetical protein
METLEKTSSDIKSTGTRISIGDLTEEWTTLQKSICLVGSFLDGSQLMDEEAVAACAAEKAYEQEVGTLTFPQTSVTSAAEAECGVSSVTFNGSSWQPPSPEDVTHSAALRLISPWAPAFAASRGESPFPFCTGETRRCHDFTGCSSGLYLHEWNKCYLSGGCSVHDCCAESFPAEYLVHPSQEPIVKRQTFDPIHTSQEFVLNFTVTASADVKSFWRNLFYIGTSNRLACAWLFPKQNLGDDTAPRLHLRIRTADHQNQGCDPQTRLSTDSPTNVGVVVRAGYMRVHFNGEEVCSKDRYYTADLLYPGEEASVKIGGGHASWNETQPSVIHSLSYRGLSAGGS